MTFMKNSHYIALLLLTLVFAGCAPQAPEESDLLVSVFADGRERTFSYPVPVTVNDLLRDAGVELNELDRVNPQPFTQIYDGMIVTVVRVEETTECEEIEVPYRQRNVLNEGLAPGEERIGQAGRNGIEQVCYRIRIEDGASQPRTEIGRTEIQAPSDEVIYVGPTGEIDPVTINGTLAYISNGNAWVMRGSSLNKRPITTTGDLDEFVFALSPDGRKLLYTRQAAAATDVPVSGSELTEDDAGGGAFANELWLVPDVNAGTISTLSLVPQNILSAAWVPSAEDTISYSTAEASETAPGWRAYNDLWQMRIDPQTGEALRIEQLIEASSFGLYSWWGTRFSWSPDGTQLAWVRADSLGTVDLETGEFVPLVEYPVFNTRQSWSWRATVSWSPESDLIATTVHVPIGNYPPETSPAFDAAVVAADGSFDTSVATNSGIWSSPRFSAYQSTASDSFPRGYIAYLKSRDPFNSINGEYDLIVADRDGSNARRLFPEQASQPGLGAQEFAWNPEGTQIAFIYQGNLWVVDVVTGASHQLTLDGGARQPIWTP